MKNYLYFTGLLDVLLCCSLHSRIIQSWLHFSLVIDVTLNVSWCSLFMLFKCCIKQSVTYAHIHHVCWCLINIVLSHLQTIITEVNHAIGATGVVSQECKAVVAEYGETIIKMILEKVFTKLTCCQNHTFK